MVKYRSLPLGLLLVFSFLALGCQPVSTNYFLGATANKMDIIPLAENLEKQQVWQDLYLHVDYLLQRDGERLEVAGSMTFSDSSKVNYTRVADMKLKFFLLDQDLLVIDYIDLARTLSYSLEDETFFNQSLALDQRVVALAFGYDGYLVDSETTFPLRTPVWKLPAR
jgi:hypothetical protein